MPTYGAKVNVRHAEIVASALAPQLSPNENILFMGRITKLTGMLAWLVITTDRTLGVRVNPEVSIEIDLDLTQITDITIRGLIPSLRITADGDTYDFGHMASVKDCNKIASIFDGQQAAPASDESRAPTTPSTSAVEDLRALTELRDSGALTDEEFAEAKRVVLAKMAAS